MRETTEAIPVTTYRSDVEPSVFTTNEAWRDLIVWADEHPDAYKLVMGKRSLIFGANGSAYLGYQRKSNDPEIVLERLERLRAAIEPDTVTYERERGFWRDRATFSLANHTRKGFRTGFFQQHANMISFGPPCSQEPKGTVVELPRSCVEYDYTPETLEMIIDRFEGWMDRAGHPDTTRITLDGKTVRAFDSKANYSSAGA